MREMEHAMQALLDNVNDELDVNKTHYDFMQANRQRTSAQHDRLVALNTQLDASEAALAHHQAQDSCQSRARARATGSSRRSGSPLPGGSRHREAPARTRKCLAPSHKAAAAQPCGLSNATHRGAYVLGDTHCARYGRFSLAPLAAPVN